MTSLVMYTNACSRPGVKAEPAPRKVGPCGGKVRFG
jgi:hypothetical protein